jgi:hypothetical protein
VHVITYVKLEMTHVIDVLTVKLLPFLNKNSDPNYVAHLGLLHFVMIGGSFTVLVKQALERIELSEGLCHYLLIILEFLFKSASEIGWLFFH